MKKIIFSLLFILSASAFGQSFSVFNIDTTNFPIMKADVFAFDAAGKQITNLKKSDFEVKENGITKNILNFSCLQDNQSVPISSVLLADVSGSMSGPILDIVKTASLAWVNMLEFDVSECAITSFSDINYLNCDFTSNKNTLIDAINNLGNGGGTNYDPPFLDKLTGSITIAAKGKNKRIIVFLSDGQPNQEPRTKDIIVYARQNNVSIYCLTIGQAAPQCMKDFATQTGGMCFEYINSEKDAIDTYLKILVLSTHKSYCTIQWQSKPVCQTNLLKTEIQYTPLKLFQNFDYFYSNQFIATIDFTPKSIFFRDPVPGKTYDTTITLIARNADFNISNVQCSNPFFKIEKTKFQLTKDQKYPIKISYTPSDSSYSYAEFIFESNLCNHDYYATGFNQNNKRNAQTLKITHPNGGEKFVLGSDTNITWTGISASDEINLDYSIDDGVSWKNLEKQVSGLKYKWKNIPRPTSQNCLIKATHDGGVHESRSQWEKSIGGTGRDEAKSVRQTSDGGYITTGVTTSKDGDAAGNVGNTALWVVKFSSSGKVEWKQFLGDLNFADYWAFSVCTSSDGGYVVSGASNNWNPHGGLDYFVAKLSATGTIQWQNSYGGLGDEYATSVKQAEDGGFIVGGYSLSHDADVPQIEDDYYFNSWILKLKSDGTIERSTTIGGNSLDIMFSLDVTPDGGFIVGGYSSSSLKDFSTNHGKADAWIVKLDSKCKVVWQKLLGGPLDEIISSIHSTKDGGYIFTAVTESKTGDVSGNNGSLDAWVVKLDSIGSIVWQKCVGGWSNDYPTDIQETLDGGFIVCGYTHASDGDFFEKIGDQDGWAVKLSKSGKIEWHKTYGTQNGDKINSIQPTMDGGYVFAGIVNSGDWWVVKLGPDGIPIQSDTSDAVFSIVAPVITSIDIDMGKCIYGKYKDSVLTKFTNNIGSYKCRIDSIYITGADAKAFKIIAGFPKYELAVGQSHYAEIDFRPLRLGPNTADIVIITQSDTIYQKIRGEGVQPVLEIVNNVIDFGKVYVGVEKDTIAVVTIKNSGTSNLFIESTKHGKPNDIDFTTLSGSAPFTLAPGKSQTMDLRFKPSIIGRTSGILEFNYEGPDSPVRIMLLGEGLRADPVIISNIGTIPNLLCDTISKTDLKLSNSGINDLNIQKIILKGNNSADFRINENYPIIIASGQERSIPVYFKPGSSGLKTAEIEIVSNSFPDSIRVIPISAKAEKIEFKPNSYSIDLGVLKPLEIKDTSLIITNYGSTATLLANTFSTNLSSINNKLFLNPGTSLALQFKFTGINKTGEFSELITITDTICGKSIVVKVIGNISWGTDYIVKLSVSNKSAFTGEIVDVPVYLIGGDILDSMGIYSLSTDLEYNNSLLWPINYTGKIIDEKYSKITLENLAVPSLHTAILTNIRFQVGLGNEEQCGLDLSNVIIPNYLGNVEVEYGTFKLLGICREGGTRLINPNSQAQILSVRPNPATNAINIEYQLTEKGGAEFLLINDLGETVKQISYGEISDYSQRQETIKLDDLANGRYTLILKTPTISERRSVLVVK